jgi:large subunit ribosomal protein L18
MKRERRIRSKLKKETLRLSVFRSNRYIHAQIIDDIKKQTLIASFQKDLPKGKNTKIEQARLVGKLLGEKALKKGIKNVVFDRGGNKYHGRVKALAEGAREAGLIF